jgi:hypothetical protein
MIKITKASKIVCNTYLDFPSNLTSDLKLDNTLPIMLISIIIWWYLSIKATTITLFLNTLIKTIKYV